MIDEEKKYTGDDGSTAIIQNQLLGMAEDFEEIRRSTRGVSEIQFGNAVKFCWLISEGKTKAHAYAEVHGCSPTDKATYTLAAALIGRKYVGEILNRMLAGNHVLMADKHVQALDEMFNIGMDKATGMMHRVNSLKAFAELTKRPEAIKIDHDVTLHVGQEMANKIDHLTKSLAAKGSMIDSSGEIIDTVVLD